MKTSPRFLALLLGVATGALPAGCSKPVPPDDAARAFFDKIAQGQLNDAYESAAFGFKAQQTAKAFETTVKEMGLLEKAALVTSTPEISGRSAKVRVTFTTPAGRTFPLVVTLNNEDSAWRVFSLKSPVNLTTGVAQNHFSMMGKTVGFNSAVNQPMPSEATVKALATESLLEFNEAIQQKSFRNFYELTSHAWQAQLTLGQLSRAFQPFIDNQINIASIAGVEPVLDPPPSISSEGILVVTGTYPTRPLQVVFRLKYVYELPKWRLFGLDVNLYK